MEIASAAYIVKISSAEISIVITASSNSPLFSSEHFCSARSRSKDAEHVWSEIRPLIENQDAEHARTHPNIGIIEKDREAT